MLVQTTFPHFHPLRRDDPQIRPSGTPMYGTLSQGAKDAAGRSWI